MEPVIKDLLKNSVPSIGADLDELSTAFRKRVLVVEDEPDTIQLLKQILRLGGFNVLSASNGKEALRKCIEQAPDLILLDMMMPEMDGWETLQNLRQMADTPVIIVSAMGLKEDIVQGLRGGADDYLTKPFHNAELIERVNSVLRRTCKSQEINHLVFKNLDLSIDLVNQEVVLRDQKIHLTPKEFGILSILAKKAPAIVPYTLISQVVWGTDSPDVRKRTKYLVYLLRRKFEKAAPGSNILLNIDRFGYKLNFDD
jgi:DNA-binding response OmpR family regulator